MLLFKKIREYSFYIGITILLWNCKSEPVNSIRMGYNSSNKSILVVYNLEGKKKDVYKLNVGIKNAATGKILSVPISNLSSQLDGISPGINKKFEISTENLNLSGGGYEVKISAMPVGRLGTYVPPAMPDPIVPSSKKVESAEKLKQTVKPATPKPTTQTVKTSERPKQVQEKKVVEAKPKPAPKIESQKIQAQVVQEQQPQPEQKIVRNKPTEAPLKLSRETQAKNADIKTPATGKGIPQNKTFVKIGISPFDVGAKQTSKTLSLSVGQVGNSNGWYISGKMGLASSVNSKYEVDEATNKLKSYDSNQSYYLFGSESSTSRLSVTGGLLIGISKDVYWTLGAGYGQRNLLWSVNEYSYSQIGQSIGQSWAINKKSSRTGLELESGLMVLSGPVNFNFNYSVLGILGGTSNNFSDLQIGLGFNF